MNGRNESHPSPLFATLPCVKNTREVGATFVDENYFSKSVYAHSETERAYMHFLKEYVLILIGNRTHVEQLWVFQQDSRLRLCDEIINILAQLILFSDERNVFT